MCDESGDALSAGLAAGRPEAFAALYDRHAASLYRVAVGMLGSPHDAEDVVQEVFVAMIRSRETLERVENLRAYLFAALRHAAMRRARMRTPIVAEQVEPTSDGPREPSLSDESARLDRALRRLPLKQREVIALKIDGDLTFAEIAAALGVSINTAASRYRYALQKLRAAMKD